MKFVVCGTLVSTEFETDIEKLSNAGNRFLMNFCKNLFCKNDGKVLSFISVPVREEIRQKVIQKKTAFQIRYFFAYENRLRYIVQYIKAVKKEIQKADCTITYNVVYAWFCVPYLTKMRKKKSLLILADYSPVDSYKSFFRKVYAYIQLRMIRKYDYVIGLSINAGKYIKKRQKFFCMEGGIDQEFYDYFDSIQKPDDEVIRLMYAGILEAVTGIEQLIQAFEQLQDKNIRLLISGKGSLKKKIEEAVERDNRIIYLGCIPYADYMEKLKSADVLINPRDMSLQENQFNFPSKILEYLGTGKQIISTRFPGWEKFAGNISFCESSIKSIKESIEKICIEVFKDRTEKYKKNRQFAEQFIWSRQVDKVLENIGNN